MSEVCNDDLMYSKAISFRDGKESEFSSEESQIQAEALFLQLAAKDHKKACHNYASIQNKKGNYMIAYDYYQKAGLEASIKNCKILISKKLVVLKEESYFVIGSDRFSGLIANKIIGLYHGLSVDLSHKSTFQGKSITMDLNKSKVEYSKHIQADAKTFDFTKKYNIKHAVLERFPTSSDQGNGKLDANNASQYLSVNNVGLCIKQLSQAMSSGAILEIEWDPHVTLWPREQSECNTFIVQNPFHGFLNINVALQGTFKMYNHTIKLPTYLQDMVDSVNTMAEHIEEELEYLARHSTEIYVVLAQRMNWEAKTLYQLLIAKKMLFMTASMQHDDSLDVIDALTNITDSDYDVYPNESINKQVKIKQQSSKETVTGYVYDINTFLEFSILNAILSSICVKYNTSYVMTYLHSIGFTDVVVERRTNEYNGRLHVWMVSAIKV